MKRFISLFLIISLLILSFVITGCGDSQKGETTQTQQVKETQSKNEQGVFTYSVKLADKSTVEVKTQVDINKYIEKDTVDLWGMMRDLSWSASYNNTDGAGEGLYLVSNGKGIKMETEFDTEHFNLSSGQGRIISFKVTPLGYEKGSKEYKSITAIKGFKSESVATEYYFFKDNPELYVSYEQIVFFAKYIDSLRTSFDVPINTSATSEYIELP